MTAVECVQLVAFVRARSPQTYLAEGTPDAWFLDLQAFDLAAAQEAVVTLSRRPGNAQISLGDLLAEIRKVRNLRLERHGDPLISVDPDDVEAYKRELARARKAICDGDPWPAKQPAELTDRERPLAALMAGTPIKSAPRRSWQERRALVPGPAKPPFTDEELRAAQAELDQAAALSRVSQETE